VEYDFYHFSEINNEVVENHIDDTTELLLFCNDDIELLNDAISEMVSVYNKNKKVCGTIGARLHFGDNTVQHDGVFLFSRKNNDSVQIGLTHYGHRSSYTYTTNTIDRIGNTAAFLMIPKTLFDSFGGFNENYIECLEDVELNLRCLLEGKRNLFCGNAVAYHYESQSRKTDGAIRQEDYQLMVGLIEKNKDVLSKFIPLMQN
jgi:GT2 family glycosyltransferase